MLKCLYIYIYNAFWSFFRFQRIFQEGQSIILGVFFGVCVFWGGGVLIGFPTAPDPSFFCFVLFFLGGGSSVVRRQKGPVSCSSTGFLVVLQDLGLMCPKTPFFKCFLFWFLLIICLILLVLPLLLPLLLFSSLSIFHLLSSPSSFSCFHCFFLTLSFFFCFWLSSFLVLFLLFWKNCFGPSYDLQQNGVLNNPCYQSVKVSVVFVFPYFASFQVYLSENTSCIVVSEKFKQQL